MCSILKFVSVKASALYVINSEFLSYSITKYKYYIFFDFTRNLLKIFTFASKIVLKCKTYAVLYNFDGFL